MGIYLQKLKRFQILIAIAVFCLLWATAVIACPACNIHNYLAPSIRSSNDIFIAEVIREIDPQTAEVKVIKVLRGNQQVGDVVKFKLYDAKEDVGNTFILCNPVSHPPTFEILPPQLESEVMFLLDKNPSVNNITDAVKLVQGVSVETQKIGMEYIRNHHNAAVELLITELNTLMPQVFSKDDVPFGDSRLSQLLEALFLLPTDAGKNFALAKINDFAAQSPAKIDWHSKTVYPSHFAEFLKELLIQTQKNQRIDGLVNTRLSQIYSKLSETALAEMSFAMIASNEATPKELNTMIEGAAAVDMLALGIYWVGNSKARWMQYEKAYGSLDTALLLAGNKELRNMINEKMEQYGRFVDRKNIKQTRKTTSKPQPLTTSNSKLINAPFRINQEP